jgi:hypothetical protein
MNPEAENECLHNVPTDWDPKTVMVIACGHLLNHQQLLDRQAQALRSRLTATTPPVHPASARRSAWTG